MLSENILKSDELRVELKNKWKDMEKEAREEEDK